MNQNEEINHANQDSHLVDISQRTSIKSDTNDIKKNRKIISDFFKLIHSKKNSSHEIIKEEIINFLLSLNKDITQIFDQDKNTCNNYIFNIK
jgi:hypothetical protein